LDEKANYVDVIACELQSMNVKLVLLLQFNTVMITNFSYIFELPKLKLILQCCF